MMAMCLAGFAGVAGAERKAERAARIFGSAEKILRSLNATQQPTDRADYELDLAATRSQSGNPAWESAWQQGLAMSMEEAIAYALEETKEQSEEG